MDQTPPDYSGWPGTEIEEINKQLRDLNSADGTQRYNAVAKLKQMITDFRAELDNYLATLDVYTKAQTNARVANPPTGVAVTGAVSATTSITAGIDVTAGGNISASGSGTFAGPLRSLGSYNSPAITTTRRAAWLAASDGLLAHTDSSERFKDNIVLAGIDPLAVLRIDVVVYQWIIELRRRDDPTFEGYVGPSYHVAVEVGMIAERLHEAGLWQFVVYEQDRVIVQGDPDDRAQSEDEFLPPREVLQLRLDENGEPIPLSIHYTLWAMAVHVAAQHIWNEHLQLRADHDALAARFDAAGL